MGTLVCLIPDGDTCSNVDHDEGDEAMHSSQESLVVTEDSISSMDIDLNALEKVIDCNVDAHYVEQFALTIKTC